MDKEQINNFFDNKVIYNKIEQLNEFKQEIMKYRKKYGNLEEPLIITVSGTPRAGKTTCIENLDDFFKKMDFKTSCIPEPAALIYQKLENQKEKKELLKNRVAFVDRQRLLASDLIRKEIEKKEIIICDRGTLDTLIWYNMYYEDGMVTEEYYNQIKSMYHYLSSHKHFFYALYTTCYESMKRDYVNSLCLDVRTTMNENYIKKYNAAMERVFPLIQEQIESAMLIDTTKLERMDASIIVANDILTKVKKIYTGR